MEAEKIFVRENIELSPFLPGDVHNLILYLNDEVIYRNTLLIPSPYTEADARWWIGRTAELFQQHGRTYNWAIRHADAGVIGGIGCFLRTGSDGHLDEIGYWLAAPYRGKGIMTDAVQVFCAWLLNKRPPLVRIEAKVHSYNPVSVGVLERAGFEREGFARKHNLKNGAYIDVFLLAKIRD